MLAEHDVRSTCNIDKLLQCNFALLPRLGDAMSIQHVTKNETLYALICRRPRVDGIEFFTPPESDFQLGVMERSTGYHVKAHFHAHIPTPNTGVTEFLYVEAGRIEIVVFDEAWGELSKVEIGAGDFALLLRGGHELTVLAPARVIEVKQGPAFAAHLVKTFRHSGVASNG